MVTKWENHDQFMTIPLYNKLKDLLANFRFLLMSDKAQLLLLYDGYAEIISDLIVF